MEGPQLMCCTYIFPVWVEGLPHVCKTINDFLMPDTIDAAVYNDWQLVQAHGETRRWTEKAIDGAAERGRLDIVEWLHKTRTEGCSIVAMDRAVVNGHFEVVKWLEANYGFGRCSNDALDAAIANGHFKPVEWLLCRHWTRGDWEQALIEAGAEGDLSMLRLILTCDVSEGLPFGLGLGAAAGVGQTEVVDLLIDRCQRSDITLAANNAAANDHIEVVKQLLLHAEPAQLGLQSNACITTGIQRVAGRGDIETLRLLLREPCNLGYLGRGLREAAASGHTHAVKLLLRSVELRQFDIRNALELAVENDHVSIVEVLVGFCTASEIKAAAARIPGGGNVEISRLLREKEFEKRKEEARVRNEVETLETIDCICNLCDCVMRLVASICGLLQEP